MLRTSITIGATAMTRESTAAVSQEVQPRFEAPDTVKDSTRYAPALARDAPASTSMARTALFTIGSSSGQSLSPVCEVLIERIGDQRVLAALEHWLKRHLPQHTDRRADRFGETREQQRLARQLGLGLRAFRTPPSSVRHG